MKVNENTLWNWEGVFRGQTSTINATKVALQESLNNNCLFCIEDFSIVYCYLYFLIKHKQQKRLPLLQLVVSDDECYVLCALSLNIDCR